MAKVEINIGNSILKGPEGPQGEQGIQGPQGESAYEVAVKHGYTGSEEKWIQDIGRFNPIGQYETTEALKTANPTTGQYIILENGHIYSWTKNQTGEPIDLGVYQATEIADGSVYLSHFEEKLQKDYKYEISKVTGVTTLNKFKKTDGTDGNWDGGQYTEYEVNYKEIYYIESYWNQLYGQKRVLFFNDNDYVASPNIDNEGLVKIVIPKNVNKMYVNCYVHGEVVLKVSGYKIKSTDELKVSLSNALTNEYEIVDNEEIISFSGFYFKINGSNKIVAIKDSNCTAYVIPVIKGEKIKITNLNIGGQFSYSYVDSNGLPLYTKKESTAEIRTYELEIPENVCYVFTNSQVTATLILQKIKKLDFGTVDLKELTEITNDNKVNLKAIKKAYEENSINEQLKNDFAWNTPNKLYISFTFDDSNADIDLIEDLFEQKNVPCCFATIPNKLNNICTNGETVKEVLDRAVANGGEVLAHWQSPLTSSSTDEDYENVYYGAKKTLSEAGFEVNGIITAGGTGYDTQDFNKDIKYARPYYRFGDLTAYKDIVGRKPTQYMNMRLFLNTDNDVNKTYIDNYVTNGKLWYENNPAYNLLYGKEHWLILASHGANDNISIQLLSDLIDYIKAKTNVEIVNMTTAFNAGKSTLLEERIKALES